MYIGGFNKITLLVITHNERNGRSRREMQFDSKYKETQVYDNIKDHNLEKHLIKKKLTYRRDTKI